VPNSAQEDLDEILDSHPLFPHWFRQGKGVVFSHITKGRHFLDIGRDFFQESLKATLRLIPFFWVTVEAGVEWIEQYDGIGDLPSVLASPRISQYPYSRRSDETGVEF